MQFYITVRYHYTFTRIAKMKKTRANVEKDMDQPKLSYPYMTTGKSTPLTRWTFVGKVMSLLFK